MLNSPREHQFLRDTLSVSKHLKKIPVSVLREATAKANHYHTAKGYRAHLRQLDEKESRIHIEGDVLHFGFYLELPSELSKTMWMDEIYDNLTGLSSIVRSGYTLTELEHTEWDMAALHFSCSCNIVPMVTSTVLMELFQHYGQSTYATHQGKTFAGLTMEEVGLKHPLLLKELFLASTQNNSAHATQIKMGLHPYDNMLADYIYNFISPVYRMNTPEQADIARKAWQLAFGALPPNTVKEDSIHFSDSFTRAAESARSILFDGPEFSRTRAAITFMNDVRLVPTGLFIMAGNQRSLSNGIILETLTDNKTNIAELARNLNAGVQGESVRIISRSDPDVVHMGNILSANDLLLAKKAAKNHCVIVHFNNTMGESPMEVYEQLTNLKKQPDTEDNIHLDEVLRGIFLYRGISFGSGVTALYQSPNEMKKKSDVSISQLVSRLMNCSQ
ncbi:hypothetical protein CMK12_16205 [Candidatus Poribacteria bacterium]|nr:hypothetical protein [Candidatus Poribacteria bacterium]